MILISVAYDLTCFIDVFDLVQTWYVFVCNSAFNGPMLQGVKHRVERDGFQVCSLRFDLFHEGFLLGLNLVYRCSTLGCLCLNLDCLCLKLIYHCPKLERFLTFIIVLPTFIKCYQRFIKVYCRGAPPLILR